jgi:hypothetical protein
MTVGLLSGWARFRRLYKLKTQHMRSQAEANAYSTQDSKLVHGFPDAFNWFAKIQSTANAIGVDNLAKFLFC